MTLAAVDEMQLVKDVAEIKGMLGASLAAHDARIIAIETAIQDSRDVHVHHDTALAAHAARLAVVEALSTTNRDRLEKAGDNTRANAALIVSIIVGVISVFVALNGI